MQSSKIVFLINDSVRAIEAIYEDGGKREIFKTMDDKISIGDLVVVESGTRHYMTVCKVTDTDVDVSFEGGPDVKWIVQKIDTKSFERVLDQEKEAISAVQSAEKKRKRDELRKAMLANHEEEILALEMSTKDPEAKGE